MSKGSARPRKNRIRGKEVNLNIEYKKYAKTLKNYMLLEKIGKLKNQLVEIKE